jgi:hypothetical protein
MQNSERNMKYRKSSRLQDAECRMYNEKYETKNKEWRRQCRGRKIENVECECRMKNADRKMQNVECRMLIAIWKQRGDY